MTVIYKLDTYLSTYISIIIYIYIYPKRDSHSEVIKIKSRKSHLSCWRTEMRFASWDTRNHLSINCCIIYFNYQTVCSSCQFFCYIDKFCQFFFVILFFVFIMSVFLSGSLFSWDFLIFLIALTIMFFLAWYPQRGNQKNRNLIQEKPQVYHNP